MASLSELDRSILEFEDRAPRAGGRKDELIRSELGLTPMRYYQRLNILIDVPAAVAEYPMMLGRLRRVRTRRDITAE